MKITVSGDIHLGRSRKNKIYYQNFFKAFELMVLNSLQTKLIIAGDLFEHASPDPYEYMKCKEILDKHNDFLILPGNHDYIFQDGTCASSVLYPNNTITEYSNFKIDDITYHLVPYSNNLYEVINNIKTFGNDILISHFTTKEMSPLYGTISEIELCKFNKVFLGDYHKEYHNNNVHTVGSLYFRDIDEMVNNKPRYITFNQKTDLVLDHYINELFIKVITDISEAIDDNILYLMIVENDIELIKKPNIMIKYNFKKDLEEYNILKDQINIENHTCNAYELLAQSIHIILNDQEPELVNSIKKSIIDYYISDIPLIGE